MPRQDAVGLTGTLGTMISASAARLPKRDPTAKSTASWPAWRDRRPRQTSRHPDGEIRTGRAPWPRLARISERCSPAAPHGRIWGAALHRNLDKIGASSRSAGSRHHLRHVMFGKAVGDHELHRLAVSERRTEGDALLGVADGELEAALGDAEPAASLVETAGRDPRLRLPHPLPFLADQVLDRHDHVVQRDLARHV